METKLRLKEAYTKIYKEEKKAREQIKKHLGTDDAIEMIKDRDNVAEDHYQCFYCTDFAYISLLHCKNHKINYCIYHNILCKCPRDIITLI